MPKQESIFEATDKVLDVLRDIEDEMHEVAAKRIVFTARRRLEAAQNDYLKQGDRVEVTKKFKLCCTECNAEQMREEDYYLHLRQKHDYSDEDAATESNNPRANYEQGLQQLRELLAEYTETYLEDA